MNEPKRRGRPPKARIEGVDVSPEVALVQAEMRAGVELMAIGSTSINPAQIYADRVWAGQSESVERGARLHRVKMALEAQGLSMEGVVLP